jgi:hypothetical protein
MHQGLDFIRVLMAQANSDRDPDKAAAWINGRWGPKSKAAEALRTASVASPNMTRAGVGAMGYVDLRRVWLLG